MTRRRILIKRKRIQKEASLSDGKGSKVAKLEQEATADRNSNITRSDSDDCPVCTEKYRDPRILECGHQFCRVCLEEIATGHPDGHVTCPTCRHVTKTGGSDNIQKLQRYRIVSDFIASVKSATTAFKISSQQQDFVKFCELCRYNPELAAACCFQCQIVMCNECGSTEHKNIDGAHLHKMCAFSSLIYCKKHQEKFNVFLCTTCDEFCCAICSISTHKEHNRLRIEDVGKETRARLQELKVSTGGPGLEEITAEQVQHLLDKARQTRAEFANSISKILEYLEQFRNKTVEFQQSVTASLDAEIKVLEMMNTDFIDFLASKKKMHDHADMLLKDISDQDLITEEKKLPRYNPQLSAEFIQSNKIQIPNVDSIEIVLKNLKEIAKYLKVLPVNFNINRPFQKLQSFPSKDKLYGFVIDTMRKRLILRYQNKDEPICIYDYDGKKLSSFGADTQNIADENYQSIALDTKRDLLLVPGSQGMLLIMDFKGKVVSQVKVGMVLKGVTYLHSRDLYLVSSISESKIYAISGQSLQLVTNFEITDKITAPYFLSTGKIGDGKYPEHLFVTCHSDHCVKMFNWKGKPIKTFGQEGTEGGQLDYLRFPQDTCTGLGGDLLMVADHGNSRLTVHRTAADTSPSGVILLDKGEIGNGRLLHLEYDQGVGKLFLGYEDGTVQIYQHRLS